MAFFQSKIKKYMKQSNSPKNKKATRVPGQQQEKSLRRQFIGYFNFLIIYSLTKFYFWKCKMDEKYKMICVAYTVTQGLGMYHLIFEIESKTVPRRINDSVSTEMTGNLDLHMYH